MNRIRQFTFFQFNYNYLSVLEREGSFSNQMKTIFNSAQSHGDMNLKDLITKSYDPSKFEGEIYDWWEQNDFFNPETQVKLGLVTQESAKFCLTLPLPNVTGQLHLGHAITIATEDLMVRFERMRQKETLFIPGTDHAGIATQNVVERELLKKGISRKKIGRKKFIKEAWKWKHKYHARITEQSKRLGMSADWGRECFTLDVQLSRAVREAFYRLYSKGLIYRGEYLINWCPGRCESAISDLETVSEDIQGHLWFIQYPIISDSWNGPKNKWGSGEWAKGAELFIEVATTRPETLLGDSAIATTLEHKKFGNLVGKEAVLPVNGRIIPIISDSHVDPEFGTGAIKVTPAHDPNDFEIGLKHGLEFITVMNESAEMESDHVGPYKGMNRFECRKAIVKDLKREGLLIKIAPYLHTVGHCQRCHTIIEPRISIQWFVKTKPLAVAAIEKVRKKEIKIIPKREEKRFFQWMENIKDWCISRQLWWGHQIPVWFCEDCGSETCGPPDIDPVQCSKCQSTNLIQDEDVLDTWFSSGLWPFSTLGWPDTEEKDYKRFFPTNVRETGYDILFFWVARELMLGIELTGEAPYNTVYLHGIIRTQAGKKISKSMENVEDYDPLKIIDKFGADSLRFVLISNSVPGLDMNLDQQQLEGAHRFCNKIWQSTKFVLSNIEDSKILKTLNKDLYSKLTFPDKWILSRLNKLVKSVTISIENYDFLKASRDIKKFFWNEYCDWYIEISKIRLYEKIEEDKSIPKVILLHVLNTILHLLHPIIPYITEKLWQVLPKIDKRSPALILSQWPESNEILIDEKIEEEFRILMGFIKEIRRTRKEYNVGEAKRIPLQIEAGNNVAFFEMMRKEIIALAKVNPEKFVVSSTLKPPTRAARIVSYEVTGHIALEEVVDLEAEIKRLKKQQKKLEVYAKKIAEKLAGPFSQKAKSEIVEKEHEKLKELQSKKKRIEDQIQQVM